MTEAIKTGVILSGIGGQYTVMDESGAEYALRAQGKLRHERLSPLVGDRVEFVPGTGDEEGWLTAILPRRNSLIRPSVANIDEIVLAVAAASPQADTLLIDRLLIAAKRAGIPASLCVTKTDLDAETAGAIADEYAGAGIPVSRVCARTGEGVRELRQRLRGKTHAFGGQSGVGKSSLINALYGLELETGSVSRKIERGKHTTRRCELIPVEGGGRVLDTPGFSLLETDLMEPRELPSYYPEFQPYEGKCYFLSCFHENEPDCAVKQALDEGKISPGRYERYLLLMQEMKERWKNRYD